MAIFNEVWMAARTTDDGDEYTPLGYSTVESEAVSLCTQENDFVCLFNLDKTLVGDPLPGYWPMLGQTELQ